jgi:hypothetical protein
LGGHVEHHAGRREYAVIRAAAVAAVCLAGCSFSIDGLDLGPGSAPDLLPPPADLARVVDAAVAPDLAVGCPGGATPTHVGEVTEGDVTRWGATPGGAKVSVDSSTGVVGGMSIRIDCPAASCTLTYPKDRNAAWNLAGKTSLKLWVAADDSKTSNDPGWSESDPHVRLGVDGSNYLDYVPVLNKLPRSPGTWIALTLPLDGGGGWIRTATGAPSLSMINYVTLSMSTFGSGFHVWVDGLTFEPAPFYDCSP